jgi:hypothetical protein
LVNSEQDEYLRLVTWDPVFGSLHHKSLHEHHEFFSCFSPPFDLSLFEALAEKSVMLAGMWRYVVHTFFSRSLYHPFILPRKFPFLIPYAFQVTVLVLVAAFYCART